MTFPFNENQLAQIEAAYLSAKNASNAGIKGAYAYAYELVFSMITENGEPKAGVDPAS